MRPGVWIVCAATRIDAVPVAADHLVVGIHDLERRRA
jgi:hypothetical protein